MEKNKITPKTTTPDEPSFNKRQFWTYKRIHPARTHKHSHRSKSPNTAKTQTPQSHKIFHEINGRIATDRTLTKRLDNIYIPPGYSDIVIAKSATNKIQAIGTDKRGRRQYIYNPAYVAKRDDRKYDDVIVLGKKIIDIENDNQRAMYNIVTKRHSELDLPADYIPIIVYMLRKYHFRIGNERYATENDSYGITTLQNRHIKFHSPTRFTIEFVGKKGIINTYTDDNQTMAAILKMLMKSAPTNNDNNSKTHSYLFAYRSPQDKSQQIITPEHIQDFFKSKYNAYITPKMFRTWYGNYHMLEHLRNLYNKNELSRDTAKQAVKSCSEYVSSKLNNTPSISKKSYIDGKLITLVMKNPVKLAEQIPADKDGQHKFLYKLFMKIRK
jgi:DNA topoisomerase-1